MAAKPPVSVVMPVYNAERYVEEAVRSILWQTFADFELVAIDDGSTDSSGEILERLACYDPRIRVIRQENSGIATARNRASEVARGELLAIMDADDICLPERLGRQVSCMTARPHLALIGAGYEEIDSSGDPTGWRMVPPARDEEIKNGLTRGCPIAQPTVMMRRDAFFAVGGYRAGFSQAEDYDLWLRLAERYRLANLPEPLVRYRVHADSSSQRSVHDQVVGVLAARACARFRRARGYDPVGEGQNLSPEILARMGISRQLVWAEVARAYRAKASKMLLLGRVESAASMLREIEALPLAARALKEIRPEITFVEARMEAARGHGLRAAGTALSTCVRHPGFVLALTVKAVRYLRSRLPQGGGRRTVRDRRVPALLRVSSAKDD